MTNQQLTPTQRVKSARFVFCDDENTEYVETSIALELAAELERLKAALKSTQNGLQSTIDHWTERAQKAEQELERVQSDMKDAAGELMLPIPEVGTPMAKMLHANVIMRHERDDLRRQLEDAKNNVQELQRYISVGHSWDSKDSLYLAKEKAESENAQLKREVESWKEAHDIISQANERHANQVGELRRQVEELEKFSFQLRGGTHPVYVMMPKERLDQLRAENAELRKDKERLDWADKNLPLTVGYLQWETGAKDFRQAIDAAKGIA